MPFEKIIDGTVTFMDRRTRAFRVTQTIKGKESTQLAGINFTIGPNASVNSCGKGLLKFTALKIGQRVIVHYITDSGDRQIANTIEIVEPAMQGASSFSGVQVAA